jgi:SAM-dependent methyltransferase
VEPEQRWLAAMWPFVQENLPPAPARVVELGCGPLGGFVPRMRALGYDCVGVDPAAPEGAEYDRTEFENHASTGPLDAVVACTSLHHVADLSMVLDRIASALAPSGRLVVIEWAHERFDEATARWCFDRLRPDGEHDWLRRHHDGWQESGQPWDEYFRQWVAAEQLHSGEAIVAAATARFGTASVHRGPYLFADLDDVQPADEQSAIDAGVIQAAGLRFVAKKLEPGHNAEL